MKSRSPARRPARRVLPSAIGRTTTSSMWGSPFSRYSLNRRRRTYSLVFHSTSSQGPVPTTLLTPPSAGSVLAGRIGTRTVATFVRNGANGCFSTIFTRWGSTALMPWTRAKSLRWAEAVLGFMIRSSEALTSSAVRVWPLWNFTPRWRLKTYSRPLADTCQNSASPGFSSKFFRPPVRRSRQSGNRWKLVIDRYLCGSGSSKAVESATRSVPPAFGACWAAAVPRTPASITAAPAALSTSRRLTMISPPCSLRCSSGAPASGPADSPRFRTPASRDTDPRIEDRVQHIDRRVDHDEEHPDDQGDPLHHRVVPREDRLDDQPADSRPGEDLLDA